jgi:hypothetical protein
MATVTAGTSTGSTGSGVATSFVPATLCTEQAVANGAGPEDSTNVVFRGTRTLGGAVVIANTGGATPTIKVDIKGSMDGTNWFNVPYSLVATPRTFVITQLTLTTTATTTYLLQEGVPYQYLKLAFSTTTNETITATAYV